ncbi:hypothetical protein N4P33_03625 [Streptomyces sp. 15-116A]|uniref:hypothetical protein n=1 Tax=Streptomyces sp. 15-116A TaxID=2259035 RepID=UPI0021B27ADB|nr:hypothetical protein [Streptomyces sp. 15-116A]MCT7351260.1 hypothetical protein [Streptomyces sp. 15-116A]
MTSAIHRPGWVPLAGHQLHLTGVYFDAVRIEGLRGELVAEQLIEATDDDAGPIVCEAARGRWVYFLLPPGTVHAYDWPLGVQQFGGRGEHTVTYIGIPALDGNTWPLRWYSAPTATAPHVVPEVLARALGVSPSGTSR